MKHAVSLGLVLSGFWLLLSGFIEPLLLGLGLLSVILVLLIALRMDVVDLAGISTNITLKGLPYWSWLLVEIIKSNLDVAKLILTPGMQISPTVVRVKASQRTELGRVIYANSITLTPGTVSIDVDGDEIEVHALTRKGAEVLCLGDMDRRVSAMTCNR